MKQCPLIHADIQGRLGNHAADLLSEAVDSLEVFGALAGLTRKHELSLVLCDNPTVRRINARWRGIDCSTDVLSFPLHEIIAGRLPLKGMLGDIIISIPYLRQAARELEIPVHNHLRHLLVHGLLHLMGYDHQSESQQRRMRRAEQALLRGKKLEA